MRPDRQRCRPGRIGRVARQPVRHRPARDELHDWRHPRRRPGAGGTEGRCPEHAQPDCDALPNESGGVARHHREALDAARGSDDIVARGAEGLQHRQEHELLIRLGTRAAVPAACGRHRSRFFDGPCLPRLQLQRQGRVDAVAAEHAQGLPAARSRQRRRALLHRNTVRPRRHRQLGTGATDVGDVDRELPARCHSSRIDRGARPEQHWPTRVGDLGV